MRVRVSHAAPFSPHNYATLNHSKGHIWPCDKRATQPYPSLPSKFPKSSLGPSAPAHRGTPRPVFSFTLSGEHRHTRSVTNPAWASISLFLRSMEVANGG